LELEQQKKFVLFIVLLMLLIGAVYVLNQQEIVRLHSDLFSRWYAARMLLEQGRSVYDPMNGAESAAYKLHPTTSLEASFFYPAHLLVILIPLSFLPFPTAHFLWTFSVAVFILLSVYITASTVKWPTTAIGLTWLLILALIFIPSIQQIIWSQFDAIGAIGMALSYAALQRRRYGLAGVLASSLTFKPQGAIFALFFLLVWSALNRKRWGFLVGFMFSCLLLWFSTELIQPGWVFIFLESLQEYQFLPYEQLSVLDRIWNPWQAVSILGAAGWLAVVFSVRGAAPDSPEFAGALCLSMGISWLAIPFIGMLYLVYLPMTVVLLLGSISQMAARYYKAGLTILLFLYLLGYLGFIIGLFLFEEGMHIHLAEFVYKIFVPFLITGTSLVLVWKKRSYDQGSKSSSRHAGLQCRSHPTPNVF
jgi:hypothetical protein